MSISQGKDISHRPTFAEKEFYLTNQAKGDHNNGEIHPFHNKNILSARRNVRKNQNNSVLLQNRILWLKN